MALYCQDGNAQVRYIDPQIRFSQLQHESTISCSNKDNAVDLDEMAYALEDYSHVNKIQDDFKSSDHRAAQIKGQGYSKQFAASQVIARYRRMLEKSREINLKREEAGESKSSMERSEIYQNLRYASDLAKEIEARRIQQGTQFKDIWEKEFSSESTLASDNRKERTFTNVFNNDDCPSLEQVCVLTGKSQELEENAAKISKHIDEYHQLWNSNVNRLHAELLSTNRIAQGVEQRVAAPSSSTTDKQASNITRRVVQMLNDSLNVEKNEKRSLITLNEQLKMQLTFLESAEIELHKEHAKEKHAFQNIYQELLFEINHLTNENAFLGEKLEKRKIVAHQLADNNFKIKTKMGALKCTLLNTKEELYEAKKEVQVRKEKEQKDMEEAKQMNGAVGTMGKDVAVLKEAKENALFKIEELRNQVVELKQQNEYISREKLKNKELKRVCKRLRGERNDTCKEREALCIQIESLNKTIKDLQTELDLTRKSEEETKQQQKMLEEKNKTNSAVDIMCKDITILKEGKETAVSRIKKLRNRVAELEQQNQYISKLRLTNKKLKRVCKRLRGERKHSRKEREELCSQIKTLKDSIESTQNEYDLAKKVGREANQQQKMLEEENKVLEKRLKEVTVCCETLQEKLLATAEVKSKLEENKAALEYSLDGANQMIHHLQTINRALEEDKIHEKEHQLCLAETSEKILYEKSSSEDKMKTNEKTGIIRAREIDELKDKVMESESKISSKQLEIKNLKALCNELEKENKNLQALNLGLEEKNAGLKELCADFDDLLKKNRKKIQEIDVYKGKIEYLEKSEKENIEYLAAMVREGKRLGEMICRLEEENQKLCDELDELRGAKSSSKKAFDGNVVNINENEELSRKTLRQMQSLLREVNNDSDSMTVINSIRKIIDEKDTCFSVCFSSDETILEENPELLNKQQLVGSREVLKNDKNIGEDLNGFPVTCITKKMEMQRSQKVPDNSRMTSKGKACVDDVGEDQKDILEIDASFFDIEVGAGTVIDREEGIEDVIDSSGKPQSLEEQQASNGFPENTVRFLDKGSSGRPKIKSPLSPVIPLPSKSLLSSFKQHLYSGPYIESIKTSRKQKMKKNRKKDNKTATRKNVGIDADVNVTNGRMEEGKLPELVTNDDKNVEYIAINIDDLLAEIL